jgi:hypothetical protein
MWCDVINGRGRKALLVRSFALLLGGSMIVVPATTHAADEWQVGSAPSFSSGRYGTDARIEVLHTPIAVRRLFDDGDLTVVFPFLCVWGDGGVTVVNGTPIRTERTDSVLAGDVRNGDSTTGVRGADADRAESAPGAAIPGQACGAGDIVVRGRYYVVDERGWVPTVALRGHVKAPTASEARGLGTGRPDEGAGVEISRTLATGTLLMLDGGYTVIGDPAGVDYDDNWWYDVGVGQDMARGVVNLSIFFEEYSSIVPGLPAARDVLAAVTVRGAGGWRVQVSGQFGLSDGAPDHGLTFGLSRSF